MSLNFFDINAFIGRPKGKACFNPIASSAELLGAMDTSGIQKAVLWHISQYDYSAVEGNRILNEMVLKTDRLFGCWTLLPPQTGEVITDDFFAGMERNRIIALRAFPDFHRFFLSRTVFNGFLEEVVARRIPLLLSLARGISWSGVYNLLQDFPDLTCILCEIGLANRFSWPLLEHYPNVYLETSLLSYAAEGIESTVRRFGARRLVFGTGFPERYHLAAIMGLLHADISNVDKEKIACQNLDNIISGIKYDK